jgi:hypothetical protein
MKLVNRKLVNQAMKNISREEEQGELELTIMKSKSNPCTQRRSQKILQKKRSSKGQWMLKQRGYQLNQ